MSATAPPPIATRPADGSAAGTKEGDDGGPPDVTMLSPRAAGPAPTLEALIGATPRCHLTPFSFFVSWQGVLTLAYR